MVHGPWAVVHGPQSMDHWSIVQGPWSMVHGLWSMDPGPGGGPVLRVPPKRVPKGGNGGDDDGRNIQMGQSPDPNAPRDKISRKGQPLNSDHLPCFAPRLTGPKI